MSTLQDVIYELLAWLIVALLAGLLGGGLWLSLRARGQPLLPPQRYRLVPWGVAEVILIAIVAYVVIPPIVFQALKSMGFYPWLYGPDFQFPKLADDADKIPAIINSRLGIWIEIFSTPFQIACIPLLLYLSNGTRPYQIGLTGHRWARDIVLACISWFIFSLPVMGVNFLAGWLYALVAHKEPETHPIVILARTQPKSLEVVAIIFMAMIKAPVWEELLFRGVVQNWLAARSWGGELAITLAVIVAFFGRDKAGLWPMAFILAMLPGYFLTAQATWRWLPDSQAIRAIYGTSLLFAAFHSSVWPTPVALFFLSLGLGYLALRTQSLVGPMVLHSLFNAVASVAIFLTPQPAPEIENGKQATSANIFVPSASTSNTVPTSWLPRRTYPSAIALPARGDTTDDVTWPTSLPSRDSFAPRGAATLPASFRPTRDRFT
jgi:membrane protease YdiL (CAAX protease family)